MKFIPIYLLHNSIPGSISTPQAAKKPKPSQSTTTSEDIEIEPHLKDVDIKSKKAEPEPSGSGYGGPGGSHASMVKADLGNESYGARGADGDDNGGEGQDFDDSMGAAGGSNADGKGRQPIFVLQLKINSIRK